MLVISRSGLSEDEILARAAAINAHSEHPLANAINEAIGDLMPEQKVEHVRKLVSQYTHVIMNSLRLLAAPKQP